MPSSAAVARFSAVVHHQDFTRVWAASQLKRDMVGFGFGFAVGHTP